MKAAAMREQKYTLIGLSGLVVLVGLVLVAVGVYDRAFVRAVPVTVLADRAGLLMDPGAPVRLNGAVVGYVRAVSTTGDGAQLVLDLNPDTVDRVSAEASVNIVPPTLFGTKFVDLVQPPGRPTRAIRTGAVLDRTHNTHEIDTFSDQLVRTLDAVPAAKLNMTLNAVAGTLNGRGAQLGAVLAQTNDYLRHLNPSLPALTADLPELTATGDLLTGVTPNLVTTLDNVAVTSDTVVDKHHELGELTGSTTRLGNGAADLLDRVEDDFVGAFVVNRPLFALLGRYSPIIGCVLGGARENGKLGRAFLGGYAMGGTHRNTNTLLSIGRSQAPYRYPRNLPTVNASGPPDCHGLPVVDRIPPYVPYDTGANPFPVIGNGSKIGDPPVGLIPPGQPVPQPAGRTPGGR